MTARACRAIEKSDVVVGYNTYIDLIRGGFPGKEFMGTGMTREVERCGIVLEEALKGKSVALISSGDSGIYGMAGLMLEVVNRSGKDVKIEVIPGVTAASAAAAVLGAPLMHDFAVISLSDLLTPWELIEKRIECAAKADFVVCLYNPKSKKRDNYIYSARDMMLRHRDINTPVGVVRNAGRDGEKAIITTLGGMLENDIIDMFTVVIIGNSKTYTQNGRMITPRGYDLDGKQG
jgi:precorrin-3B C17-methyltransferase